MASRAINGCDFGELHHWISRVLLVAQHWFKYCEAIRDAQDRRASTPKLAAGHRSAVLGRPVATLKLVGVLCEERSNLVTRERAVEYPHAIRCTVEVVDRSATEASPPDGQGTWG